MERTIGPAAAIAAAAIAAAAAVIAAAGCTGDARTGAAGGSGTAAAAGVPVIDNAAPRHAGSGAWRLSTEPVLQIGAEDGGPGETLHRVNSSARLSDGRIVVFDGGSQELRYFDASSRFLRAASRRGGGPGEFEMGGGLRRIAGDTVLLTDFRNNRLTYFDAQGVLAGTLTLQPPDPSGGVMYLARLPEGGHMTSGGRNAMYIEGRGDGLHRGQSWVTRLAADGASRGHVLEYDGGESITLDGGRMSLSPPFGRRDFVVVAGDAIVQAYSESYELNVHDFAGTLRHVIRRSVRPEPVTSEQMADYRDRYAQASPMPNAREIAGRLEFPATHPAFRGLLADAAGNVWVEAYRIRPSEGQPVWSVFGPDGVWLTDVETPQRFVIHDIGDDYVLGSWRDELGVEYIRMYALQKGRAS